MNNKFHFDKYGKLHLPDRLLYNISNNLLYYWLSIIILMALIFLIMIIAKCIPRYDLPLDWIYVLSPLFSFSITQAYKDYYWTFIKKTKNSHKWNIFANSILYGIILFMIIWLLIFCKLALMLPSNALAHIVFVLSIISSIFVSLPIGFIISHYYHKYHLK